MSATVVILLANLYFSQRYVINHNQIFWGLYVSPNVREEEFVLHQSFLSEIGGEFAVKIGQLESLKRKEKIKGIK